jgi:hypothetical protein
MGVKLTGSTSTAQRFAIQAFVGANGTSKSYAAMHQMVIPGWRQGQVCWSNLQLYPEALGFPAQLYRRLVSWRQLATIVNANLFLDDISSVLPSRESRSVPPDLVRRLNQLRKADSAVAWTAPAWGRCDLVLREVTRAVTVCHSFFPDGWTRQSGTVSWRHPSGVVLVDEAGRKVRSSSGWEPRRLFQWTTYDADEFSGEFTAAVQKKVKARSSKLHWRPAAWTFGQGRSEMVQDAYGTMEEVGLLDHLDDVGVCVACGGQRSRARCSCAREIVQVAR